jgi:hypothetical protein
MSKAKAMVLPARVRYASAEPEQFGTLHGRMKYLLMLGRRDELWRTHGDVWQAIWDLQTEVEGYQPISPPFGTRPVPRPRR